MIVNTITILPAMTTKRSRGANYLGPRDGVITNKVEGSATLTSKRERDEAFKNVMDNVFGNGVSVTRHMGAGNLDLKESGKISTLYVRTGHAVTMFSAQVHTQRLAFRTPHTGKYCSVQCSLPRDRTTDNCGLNRSAHLVEMGVAKTLLGYQVRN